MILVTCKRSQPMGDGEYHSKHRLKIMQPQQNCNLRGTPKAPLGSLKSCKEYHFVLCYEVYFWDQTCIVSISFVTSKFK